MELVVINAETAEVCKEIIRDAYERVLPLVHVPGTKKDKNFIQSVLLPGRQINLEEPSSSVAMKDLEEPKEDLQVAVVIDGATLDFALGEAIVDDFLKLCSLCCSVVSLPIEERLLYRYVAA
jgi:hypothetical protein